MNQSSFASDLLWVIMAPAIVTALWWILSRGAITLLGTSNSPRVQRWTRVGLWIVLISAYFISFGLLAYKYLKA
jgi:hypothetical protein